MEAEREMDRGAEARDVSVDLGPYAAWIGPGIFAFLVAAYALVLAFESSLVDPNLVSETLGEAKGQASASANEYVVAHVRWRASALLLIAAALAAAVASLTLIAVYGRTARLQVALTGVPAALVPILTLWKGGGAENPTLLLAQLIRVMGDDTAAALQVAVDTRWYAETAAILVGVAVASVLALPRKLDASELAARVERLRLMLFVSAVLFVAGSLTNMSAYSWAVAALSSYSGIDAETGREIVVAGTYLGGAFYTVLLAALFLPCAAVVVLLGRRLALEVEGDARAWLQAKGLAFTWSTQFANIGALLAPLASTLVAQVLSSLV